MWRTHGAATIRTRVVKGLWRGGGRRRWDVDHLRFALLGTRAGCSSIREQKSETVAERNMSTFWLVEGASWKLGLRNGIDGGTGFGGIFTRGAKSKKKGKKKKEAEMDDSDVGEDEDGDDGPLLDVDDLKEKMDKIVEGFQKELSKLRAGQTDPSMLDHVSVDAYGGHTPLSRVGQVSFQSSKLLHVNVFDPSLVSAVEKAITNSGLGLNPQVDGTIVKVPIPKTTKESREATAKVAKTAREKTKQNIANIRRDALKRLKKKKGASGVSEDDLRSAHEELDELINEYHTTIQSAFEKREAEILAS